MTEQRPSFRIIRMKELISRIGYARSTIYAFIKEGRFPPPFKLSPDGRAIGWSEETINEWIDHRKSDLQYEDNGNEG